MLNYKHSVVRKMRGGSAQNGKALLLLSLLFLAGAFCGSVLGGTESPNALLADLPVQSGDGEAFWQQFANFTKYHAAVFLLGTSYYGVLFLPLLCALRGYALSRTAASLLFAGGSAALPEMLFQMIPGELFSLACFFVLLDDAFANAGYLFDLVRNRHRPRPERRALRALLCIPVLICGNAVNLYLVPRLVSLLR